MRTLIISLPLAAHNAHTSYNYVTTLDGQSVVTHASATADLLSVGQRSTDVVVVVPCSKLSWHTLQLPKGVVAGSPRLQAVIENLLEDRVLDEPDQLHVALAPAVSAGTAAWVAACDKRWLREHLNALEAVQLQVSRVVPEFSPETGPTQMHAIGEENAVQCVFVGTDVGGVVCLPLSPAVLALFAVLPDATENVGVGVGVGDDDLVRTAEPAVAALAEQVLQCKVSLITRPQRLLSAARSPWNLAQFGLANSGRSRTVKRFTDVGHAFLQAPLWRPARWGAAMLLLVNVLGLNAWAWREQSALQARKLAVQSTLTQTFPEIRVVVDAPLQMAREVAALRQATGAASERDLEAMLGVLAASLPPGRTLGAIEFTTGEARLKGLQLTPQDATALTAQIKLQGYTALLEGETLLLKSDSQSSLASQETPNALATKAK